MWRWKVGFPSCVSYYLTLGKLRNLSKFPTCALGLSLEVKGSDRRVSSKGATRSRLCFCKFSVLWGGCRERGKTSKRAVRGRLIGSDCR